MYINVIELHLMADVIISLAYFYILILLQAQKYFILSFLPNF